MSDIGMDATVDAMVRVCPVCEQENAPQSLRCSCGASLLGVDFSIRKSLVSAPEEHFTQTTPKALTISTDVLCPYADCAQP
ncbi:MAG: hypothetical protein ABIZ09_13450, partial [Rhodoferax sp.]